MDHWDYELGVFFKFALPPHFQFGLCESEFQLTILLFIGLPQNVAIQKADKTVPGIIPNTSGIPTKEVSSILQPAKPLPIPPGLSSAQDFPPLVTPQKVLITQGLSTRAATAIPLPVTPAVPILPSKSTPHAVPAELSKSQAPKPAEGSSRGNKDSKAALNALSIVAASQKSSEMALKETTALKVASSPHIQNPTTATASKSNTSTTDAKDFEANKPSSEFAEKRQRPGKLDITAAKDASRKDLGLVASSNEQAKPATPSKNLRQAITNISQPGTPATAVSQPSASPGPHQTAPRTVRVVQIPKLETPSRIPTGVVSTMAPFTVVSRQVSRQPSLASIDQPGTPFNEVSDNASLTSTSMSRPGSPPLGKVGTSPVRFMTKSQQKKERQARAKRVEESRQSEEPSSATMPEEPVQAPIIGRKKKTKKSKLLDSTDSMSVASGPVSPLQQDERPRESPNAANQSIKEAKKMPIDVTNDAKKRLDEATPGLESETLSGVAAEVAEKIRKTHLTAAMIFADLQRKGQIPSNAIDIFRNVPGVNHRFDLTEADLAEINVVPSLTEEQHQLLAEGKPIWVETVPNKHAVVLPDRQVLRGFTRDQAERYMKLRQQIVESTGASSFRSGRHSIDRWLNSRARAGIINTIGDAFEQTIMTSDGEQHLMTDLFATPMSRDKQLQMASENFSEGAVGPRASVAEGLPVRQATVSVEEAERALAASRKETEALEKRLNVLLKKNRKLLNAH